MKILALSSKAHYAVYLPDLPVTRRAELVFRPRTTPDGAAAAACPDAEVLCVDAMRPVSRAFLERLPRLKMVHCEGVGFDRIDLEAARERGIYVCNNRGSNADAVAEQAILLLLMLLRSALPRHRDVWEGRFHQAEEAAVRRPMTELSDCAVGLVGFGDIARATARRLSVFGCRLFYHTPRRKPEEVEREYGVTYLPLEELTARCDVVSLHCPATPETEHLVDEAFLRRMRPTAYLLNTARGSVVDSAALGRALAEGWIAGAGLDTFENEPTLAGNPLLALPEAARERLVCSPHIGGLTTRFFRLGHENMWRNIALVEEGRRPGTVVNGL